MSWFFFKNHCLKSVRIGSYSGLYFPTCGLTAERYGISLHIQFEFGKIRTRIPPNTDTFYAVSVTGKWPVTTMTPAKVLLETFWSFPKKLFYRILPNNFSVECSRYWTASKGSIAKVSAINSDREMPKCEISSVNVALVGPER